MFTANECKMTITDGDRTYEFPCANVKITQNNDCSNYMGMQEKYVGKTEMKLSAEILQSGSDETFGKITDNPKPSKKNIWKIIGEYIWG